MNKIALVNYATKYALHPNKTYKYFKLTNNLGGDCSNYISQCLYSGGLNMRFSGYPWWYKNNSCSSSWSVAHELYWFLIINNIGKRVSVSELKLGDLIFFEDKNGVIFHSSVVTAFSNNSPLISQHTPEALNIAYLSSWSAKKYHFIKLNS